MEPATWSMISAVVAALAFGLSLWNTVSSKSRKEFDSLMKARAEHDERLTRVEGSLAALPNAAQFHDLRVAMEAVKGSVGVVDERIRQIGAIATRLQDALLEQKR